MCADTITANYGWVKPDPGGDANTWGNILNSTTDKIDAQVYTNQVGNIPVGAITMWGAAAAPTNWVLCDGSSYSTSGTYAALFAVLGTTYNQSGDSVGTFRVPNLTNAFPYGGAALGVTGGEASHTLTNTELPSHFHSITDVAHNHGINQSPHTHPDSGHSHGASAGDSGHTHPGVVTGLGGLGGVIAGQVGGATLPTSNTGIGYANISVSIAGSGANIGAQNANISLNASGTGLTGTDNYGGGGSHNNMPPFLGVAFIIKFK